MVGGYTLCNVHVRKNDKNRIQTAIRHGKPVEFSIATKRSSSIPLFLTKQQIRRKSIKFSPRQSKYNQKSLQGNGFVDTLLNKLPMPELHLPLKNKDGKVVKASFCGPFTKLNQRLDENGNPHPWSEPVNELDRGCLDHDKAYSYKGRDQINVRKQADRKLMMHAKNIADNPSIDLYNRVSAMAVQKVMNWMQQRK